MKFGVKLFLYSVLVLTIAFSLSGYLLISNHFSSSTDRETARSLEEHQSIKFMLQSEIVSARLQGEILSAAHLANICREVSGSYAAISFLVSDLEGVEVFSSLPVDCAIPEELAAVSPGQQKYVFIRGDTGYYALAASRFTLEDEPYLFISLRDATNIFLDLEQQTGFFIWFDLAVVVLSSGVLYVLSSLLTRPIRQVVEASRRIAGGAYDQRVRVRSRDEIGDLAASFNTMAGAVEERIRELQLAARQKEDFVANFAHELKTPLTSIIGYADLLRSRECDEETRFRALSYIFSEGKRLESLSLKLLELIVLNHQDFTLSPVNAALFFSNIGDAAEPLLQGDGMRLDLCIEDGVILAERDLLTTLLLNLIDNARKASHSGAAIHVLGARGPSAYVVQVQDQGIGIPEAELERITEAFYMVDKSRARKQHGAGLGLSICQRIAEIHGAALQFESRPNQGTTVSLSLPIPPPEASHEDE